MAMDESSPLAVDLEAFEGPLDLLLHLIRKHEIDIFDIPIHFITERFLDALGEMERLDLNLGGEFLVMAATLAQIKSRMLLPRPEGRDEQVDEADPRADLVRQLVEYQKYKELAERLDEREHLGRDVFVRPGPRAQTAHPAPWGRGSLDLFQLIDAFERVKRRAGFRRGFEVTVSRRSVGEEMTRLAERLSSTGRATFWDLVEVDEAGEVAVTSIVGVFLALLELARRGLIRVRDSATDPGDLVLESAVVDLESAVKLRVDDFGRQT